MQDQEMFFNILGHKIYTSRAQSQTNQRTHNPNEEAEAYEFMQKLLATI